MNISYHKTHKGLSTIQCSDVSADGSSKRDNPAVYGEREKVSKDRVTIYSLEFVYEAQRQNKFLLE